MQDDKNSGDGWWWGLNVFNTTELHTEKMVKTVHFTLYFTMIKKWEKIRVYILYYIVLYSIMGKMINENIMK